MDENLPPPPGDEPPRRYFEEAEPEPSQGPPPPGRYFDDSRDGGYGYQDAGFTGKPSGGLMAMGIITIVVASLMLLLSCCGLGGILMYKIPSLKNMPGMGQNAAMMEGLMSDPVVMASMVVGFIVQPILYILAIVGGVGLVKLKNWGRRICLGYAVVSMVYWLISFVVNIAYVQPRTAEVVKDMPGGQMSAELSQNVGFQIAAQGFNALCYNILPVALLIVLLWPSVKEQFRKAREMGTG